MAICLNAVIHEQFGTISRLIFAMPILRILARGLHEYIDDLQLRLNYVSQSVYSTFFAMKPVDTDRATTNSAG